MSTHFIDLTGQRFGRLRVIELVGRNSGNLIWRCVCDCGKVKTARSNCLLRGAKSCGCQRRESSSINGRANRTHGHAGHKSRSPTYTSWRAMCQRCDGTLSKGHKSLKYYAERGITVCERWRSFENFLADMGERPAGKTLDRWPNNEGNYEPGNCRWATPSEQASHRRPRRDR